MRGNDIPSVLPSRTWGSSPLTRGKQSLSPESLRASGLIPAHAGKTTRMRAKPSTSWAHPRSCGENPIFALILKCGCGSSPLMRGKLSEVQARPLVGRLIPAHTGKLRAGGDLDGPARLIPAHAGKTPCPASSHSSRRAHPRSCGENNPDLRFYRADRSDLGKP